MGGLPGAPHGLPKVHIEIYVRLCRHGHHVGAWNDVNFVTTVPVLDFSPLQDHTRTPGTRTHQDGWCETGVSLCVSTCAAPVCLLSCWSKDACAVVLSSVQVLCRRAQLVTYIPALHVLVNRVTGARTFAATILSGCEKPSRGPSPDTGTTSKEVRGEEWEGQSQTLCVDLPKPSL